MHDENVAEFRMGEFFIRLSGPRPTFLEQKAPPDVTALQKNDGLTDDERIYGVGAAEWQR
jgi:hypothetical protein